MYLYHSAAEHIRVPAQIGKAVLLCIGFKDTLLIGNGIAFALQLVLMG